MLKKSYKIKKSLIGSLLLVVSLFVSGCSSFSGIRTPKFDGEPFEINEEKITAYQNSQEVIGEEKEYYIQKPFSEDVLNPSLDYIEHEPFLLKEGSYVIGEDLPAGRVNLYGQAYMSSMDGEVPAPNIPSFSAGTLFIHDLEGDLYFENMFHELYGTTQAQVDFIEGHTIEITGVEPAFVVFYDSEIPEDPYIFDPRYVPSGETEEISEAEEAQDLLVGPMERSQPIEISEDGKIVELQAGIYEVGVHFEPGTYEINETGGPLLLEYTEIFLFREGEETRVFEVHNSMVPEDALSSSEEVMGTLELEEGDKIYPSYMNFLQLIRINEKCTQSTTADEPAKVNHINNSNTLPFNSFYLTLMEGTSQKQREEFNPKNSYEIHVKEQLLRLNSSVKVIGLDGNEIEAPNQELQNFEVQDDGTISFSYDEEVVTETDSWIENITITFTKLSDSVYEDENGIRYQLLEELE